MGDISIKNIGTVPTLDGKTAYFLASIVLDDGSWNTKNISYTNLSNDLSSAIVPLVPAQDNFNKLTSDIQYIGSLSTELSNASTFAKTFNKLGSFLTGIDLTNDKLTVYVNNSIVPIDTKVESLSTNIAIPLSNLITSGDICVDISNLLVSANYAVTSVDTIAETVSKLDLTAVAGLAGTVKSISDDLYIAPDEELNYTPGLKYAIVDNILDLSGIAENLQKFIEPEILEGTKLSDYIKSIADAAYVKGIVDATYVKGIVDATYVKGIVDANYNIINSTAATKIDNDNTFKNSAKTTLTEYIKNVIDTYHPAS